MGWVAAAGQWIRELVRPSFVITELGTFDAPPRPVDQVIGEMLANGYGSRVSRSQALSVAAVQRARNELCAIATLPLRLYRGLDVMQSPLLAQLDANLPNVVTLSGTIEDLIFEGLAWWHIMARDFDGFPLFVERVDVGRISLAPPAKDGGLTTTPAGTVAAVDAGPTVWLDGRPQPARDFIRFDSPNPGLLRANARAIRRALLLDALAAVYADNPRPLDYFTDSDDATTTPMSDDEVRAFLAEWQMLRKRSSSAWIPGNVKRVDVDAPSPADLQLVELQRQATLEIANGTGVDAEDLGVSTTSRTYFNGVDRRQEKINRTYAPYMKAITDRLTMGDVTRRGYETRFDLTDYLKSDPASQVTYWRGLWDMGVVSSSEVRAAAGISGPVPADAGAPAAVAASSQPPAAPRLAVVNASSRFDERPGLTFSTAEFSGSTPAPSVDESARTIEGLALPYNATANKYGLRYRFLPGSLEWSDTSRVKFLQDHVTPVGSAVELADGKDGLTAKLAVLSGPDGSAVKASRDQLLYDAKAGLYDGLSVGVDFSYDPEDGDLVLNADDGVYEVHRATLREISSTPMPAFDDARVSRVAASRGGAMPCQHCGREHAAGIACATFTRQLEAAAAATRANAGAGGAATLVTEAPPASPVSRGTEELAAAFAALLAAQPAGGFAGDGAPVVVNPHRGPALEVSEPAPYRFDRYGNLRAGSHDFSSDLFMGWAPGGGGDQAARDRAESFMRAAFEGGDIGSLEQGAGSQFAITPANVTNLNYPTNRPDLYVDQLDFLYPLYAGTFKGTLDVVTPFVIPKFSSSSGLVADHVTGTEPTPGAFTATAQTITPSAVSGKVEITREAFDQGGNPQMSGLIWKQMTRGWYEALEAFVQAQLVAAAASITDITITTAAADSVLDAAVAAAIVPLQYIRGGDRYRVVYTQVDLYKALAAAKDSTGRRLYPMVNPQNSNGQVNGAYNTIDAHGKLWVPAWATAATSVNPGSSWMFDPDVVCLWASAPQRIDMQWRVAWVDMGLFGYKAFGVTDFTRTREIVYDPV